MRLPSSPREGNGGGGAEHIWFFLLATRNTRSLVACFCVGHVIAPFLQASEKCSYLSRQFLPTDPHFLPTPFLCETTPMCALFVSVFPTDEPFSSLHSHPYFLSSKRRPYVGARVSAVSVYTALTLDTGVATLVPYPVASTMHPKLKAIYFREKHSVPFIR